MEKYIAADYQPANLQLSQVRKGGFEFAFDAGIQDMELQPHGTGGRVQIFHGSFGIYPIDRIDEHSKAFGAWAQFV